MQAAGPGEAGLARVQPGLHGQREVPCEPGDQGDTQEAASAHHLDRTQLLLEQPYRNAVRWTQARGPEPHEDAARQEVSAQLSF